jgi:hypothetical protein
MSELQQSKHLINRVVETLTGENKSLQDRCEASEFTVQQLQSAASMREHKLMTELAETQSRLMEAEQRANAAQSQLQEMRNAGDQLAKINMRLVVEVDALRQREFNGTNLLPLLRIIWQLTSHPELIEEALKASMQFAHLLCQLLRQFSLTLSQQQQQPAAGSTTALNPIESDLITSTLGIMVNIATAGAGRVALLHCGTVESGKCLLDNVLALLNSKTIAHQDGVVGRQRIFWSNENERTNERAIDSLFFFSLLCKTGLVLDMLSNLVFDPSLTKPVIEREVTTKQRSVRDS